MASAEELATWLNGTATGGPNSDGRYPMTDLATGTTYLVYCPAAQALNPALSEQPIEVFANTASAAATSASEDAAAADQARIDAQTYAANAAASATTANTHKNAAATSATNAATSATNAGNSATTASTAQTAAETAQAAAETARNKAQDWADKAVDTEVETGKYSARHWAQKAADSAASVSMGNYYTKTEADAKFMLLPDTTPALALDNDYANIPKHLTITNYGAADASVPVGYATLITFNYADNCVAQFAVGSQSSEFYWRGHRTTDAGWQPWRKLWHDGNLTPDNFYTDQFKAGGTIPTAADLNTYTTPGIYHQSLNANAAAGINYPEGQAGVLFVYSASAMVYQTYQHYSNGKRWHRSHYNGTWSAWAQEHTTSTFDPATKANVASPSFTGTVTVAAPGSLGFGSATRQMLNLYSSSYALGVQFSTLYCRSGSGFAWYRGGAHSDTQWDPGTGGSELARLASDGVLSLYNKVSVTHAVDARVEFGCTAVGASTYALLSNSTPNAGIYDVTASQWRLRFNGGTAYFENLGTAPAGSYLSIASPGATPGIVAQYSTTKRRDISFRNDGIWIAASSNTSGPTAGVLIDDLGNLAASGDVYANGTTIYGDSKGMLGFSDSWLRLNPSGHFASGIYTGTSLFRSDGSLQVGSTSTAGFYVTTAVRPKWTNKNLVLNLAGVDNIEKITQAAYDALGTKDAATLYVIVG